MKLLAIGDLHLGRQPSRLPPGLRDQHESRQLGPAKALEIAVDEAIRAGVDAVVLAGDVVEREDDFFEAYRHLHSSVSRLVEANIPVLGVAGNHDVKVLPRLATQIPSFRLLGQQGQWEHATLEAKDQNLTLWGRSFTADRMREAPLQGTAFQRQRGINLGLLHCDLDQRDSPYAPVSRTALEAAGLDGWLLGHIHVPSTLVAPNPSGYLGSMTGLDPGESGARGPWLISIEAGQIVDVSQWALAPLRWERLDVDITEIDEPERVRECLLEVTRQLDKTLSDGDWPPRAVGLRIRLTGRSRFGAAAAELFTGEERAHIHTGARQTHYFIERIQNTTRPEISLLELATRGDPPALLAARLLLLDQHAGNPERRNLIDEARKTMENRLSAPQWAGLNHSLSDQQVEAYLRKAAIAALEQLLAQRRDRR